MRPPFNVPYVNLLFEHNSVKFDFPFPIPSSPRSISYITQMTHVSDFEPLHFAKKWENQQKEATLSSKQDLDLTNLKNYYNEFNYLYYNYCII